MFTSILAGLCVKVDASEGPVPPPHVSASEAPSLCLPSRTFCCLSVQPCLGRGSGGRWTNEGSGPTVRPGPDQGSAGRECGRVSWSTRHMSQGRMEGCAHGRAKGKGKGTDIP